MFWKLYAGNFFGNYMLGNFLKLYAGKLFGNYMLENSDGYQRLFDGGNHGTMLRYHTTVSRQWDLEC